MAAFIEGINTEQCPHIYETEIVGIDKNEGKEEESKDEFIESVYTSQDAKKIILLHPPEKGCMGQPNN